MTTPIPRALADRLAALTLAPLCHTPGGTVRTADDLLGLCIAATTHPGHRPLAAAARDYLARALTHAWARDTPDRIDPEAAWTGARLAAMDRVHPLPDALDAGHCPPMHAVLLHPPFAGAARHTHGPGNLAAHHLTAACALAPRVGIIAPTTITYGDSRTVGIDAVAATHRVEHQDDVPWPGDLARTVTLLVLGPNPNTTTGA